MKDNSKAYTNISFYLENNLGKTIKSGKISNEENIDLTQLSNGLYILVFEKNGIVIQKEKIIKL